MQPAAQAPAPQQPPLPAYPRKPITPGMDSISAHHRPSSFRTSVIAMDSTVTASTQYLAFIIEPQNHPTNPSPEPIHTPNKTSFPSPLTNFQLPPTPQSHRYPSSCNRGD